MNYRAYEDFDLLFERVPAIGHDVYQVRLLNSPDGETKVEFGKYYSPQQWLFFQASANNGVINSPIDATNFTISPLIVPQSELPKTELGKLLFTHVFHGKLLLCWMNSLRYVTQNNLGLRILLRLNDVPELATLPWEYLCAPKPYDFIALSARTPIVRYLEIAHRNDTTVPVTEKLRILVVVSDPLDNKQLEVTSEWEKLQETIEELQKQNQVELEALIPGTLEGLHSRLQQPDNPVHILHFIGHGTYDSHRREGILNFETLSRTSDPVTGDRLTTILKDHSSLQLIFLNSCESAQSGEQDIFSGSAQNLFRSLHSNLLGVIAMQTEIRDHTAINLAQAFYRVLAAGYPITVALAEARRSLARDNNDEWGVPVLFMRAYDGKFLDIPISTQYFGFQKLKLENKANQIEPKISKKLLQILYDSHLIILSEEPKVTLQALAYQIAYELYQKQPNLSILEWQEDPEKLNFRSLFPLDHKFDRASDNAIFIISEISRDLFTGTFLAELHPLLAERQQYLILTTATAKNTLDLNRVIARFWIEPEKAIYKAKYLSDELEKRLKKNEMRLPQRLLDRLKEGGAELGYSLSKIATELRLPIHMDTFVERLCRQDEAVTKEHLREWIQVSKKERDEDRIKYLYHSLPQRSDQLLVVGLCLLGGTTETQFFQLLERIIKSSWQYAFTEVEILDYYHLHHLHYFFKYEEQDKKRYTIERTILPQYTNQWWHLLLIIWESHRNHLSKTFRELATITLDSVSDQREDYGNEQERQRLRNSIGTLFSNIGRIWLPSIEDTLLDLASYRYPSIQALVADAIARWYDKNEKLDARDQLFQLLQRWLSRNWSKESNWKSNPRDQRYIRFTIARILNQVLDKATDPLQVPLPDSLSEVINSYDKVQQFFSTNISRKIFPHRTAYIIECWRNLWEKSSKVESVGKWLEVIKIIAPLCKRHNQLHLIAQWLVDVLAYGVKQHGDDTIVLLRENPYLIPAAFPAHLLKLNKDGTLLYLARCGRFEIAILDVLRGVHNNNAQLIQTIIEQWQVQWSSYHDEIKELDENDWYDVLTLIGKFYDDIDQFASFKPWLPRLIEEDDINTQSQLVEVLYRIACYQREKIANTVLNGLDVRLIPAGAERIAYTWLSDEQRGAAFHLIAFWFSAKLLGVIDRRSIRRNFNKTFYLKSFIPFCVSPFPRRYRVIVGNLLPVVDRLFQDKPAEISKIVHSWINDSNNTHVRQIGHRLKWALCLCAGVRWLGTQLSRISKSK